ncbi:rCG59652, isoform CRA_a [Rattus norvegicus]|uniref:RCG59652, isoform CRA_a n=1 Tax=Rattus norvegicus TaxID=10116 RepID=A6HT15_RAT|nr:rCG59652, isoform CRA_a [Rattus norvegicus]
MASEDIAKLAETLAKTQVAGGQLRGRRGGRGGRGRRATAARVRRGASYTLEEDPGP